MGKRVYFVCVCVCVAGYMVSLMTTDLLIQPLNYSVVGKRCYLTNDVWLIATPFDEGPYEEVFSTTKEDLLTVEDRKMNCQPFLN